MRVLIFVLVIVLFVLAGIVFGSLNSALIDYDFGFVQLELPKGAALLAAVVVGWVLGGCVAWLGTASSRRRAARKSTVAVPARKRAPHS